MVDFELPEGLGWTIGSTTINSIRKCDEPFGWVGADRREELAPGRVGSAEAKRRKELHSFWERVRKFRMPGQAPRASEAAAVRAVDAETRSAPCDLAFGGHAGYAEGRLQACRYHFPLDRRRYRMVIRSAGRGVRPSRPPPRGRVSLVHSRLEAAASDLPPSQLSKHVSWPAGEVESLWQRMIRRG